MKGRTPKKIKEEGGTPTKIKLIHLNKLSPCILGLHGIDKIRMLAEELAEECGIKKRPPVRQAEDEAGRALRYLFIAASSGEPHAAHAARAIHRIAERVTLKMNSLAARDKDLWKPILEGAIGWPIVYSETQDEKACNEAVIERVGSTASFRSRPEPGTKSLRFKSTELNNLLILIGGCFNPLDAAVKHLTSDNPSAEKFSERLDELLEKMPDGIKSDGIRTVMSNLRACRGFQPKTQKELAQMIFDWIDAEAGGRIEAVDFFRKRGVNSDALGKDIGQVDASILEARKKFPKTNSEITDSERKDFLLKNIGSNAVEKEIRNQIRRVIVDSLKWFKPPVEAHQ